MPDRDQAEVQVRQELSLSNEPGLLKRVEKLDAVVCPHVQAVFSWVYPKTREEGQFCDLPVGFFQQESKQPD